jgi:putative ABC transport system permease protein
MLQESFSVLPLAFWAMKTWLAGFAFRVSITAWTFVGAAAAAFFLTILTVGLRASRAAASNPVDGIRRD